MSNQTTDEMAVLVRINPPDGRNAPVGVTAQADRGGSSAAARRVEQILGQL